MFSVFVCMIDFVMIFGDGIGFEVIFEVVVIFCVVVVDEVVVEVIEYLFSVCYYFEIGEILNDDDFVSFVKYEVMFFGVVGGDFCDLKFVGGIIECGLLFKFCFVFDYYVNLCLICLFFGVISLFFYLGEVDFVVVWEGIEGLYVGNGGSICVGILYEIVNEVSVNMVFGVDCVVKYVFELVECCCKKFIFVYKMNVLINVGLLWVCSV